MVPCPCIGAEEIGEVIVSNGRTLSHRQAAVAWCCPVTPRMDSAARPKRFGLLVFISATPHVELVTGKIARHRVVRRALRAPRTLRGRFPYLLPDAPTEELRFLIRVIRHLGRNALGRSPTKLQGNDDKFLIRLYRYSSICVNRIRKVLPKSFANHAGDPEVLGAAGDRR